MSSTTPDRKSAFIRVSQEYMEFFFSLMAVYIIPALFVSSVILALEVTNDIDAKKPLGSALVWCAGVVLTVSIEAGSIGSFNLARKVKDHGHSTRAFWVTTMGVVLTLLVITTLAFAALKVKGTPSDVLTLVRIAAAVLYALAAHTQGTHDEVTPKQKSKIDEMLAQFRQEQARHFGETLQQVHRNDDERIQQLSEKYTEQIRQITETHTEHFARLSEETEKRIRSLETHFAEATERLTEMTENLTKQPVETIAQISVKASPNTEKPFSEVSNIRPFAPKAGKHRNPPNTEFDKTAFVRSCFGENPNYRNAEIIQLAETLGQKISASHVSEIRKAYFEQSDGAQANEG